MGQIPLTKEPLDIAVGCRADMITVQGRSLVAVAARVGFVALGAVFVVDPRTGCDRFGLVCEWIESCVILDRNMSPVRMGCCGKSQRRTEDEGK